MTQSDANCSPHEGFPCYAAKIQGVSQDSADSSLGSERKVRISRRFTREFPGDPNSEFPSRIKEPKLPDLLSNREASWCLNSTLISWETGETRIRRRRSPRTPISLSLSSSGLQKRTRFGDF